MKVLRLPQILCSAVLSLAMFFSANTASAQYLIVEAPASYGGWQVAFTPTTNFGSAINSTWTGQAVFSNDTIGAVASQGCNAPLGNTVADSGKIFFVDRGTCAFVNKCINAQDKGAIAVIVCNNAAGNSSAVMGGSNAAITIPCVMIGKADCDSLRMDINAGLVTMTLTDRLPVNNNLRLISYQVPDNYKTPYCQTSSFLAEAVVDNFGLTTQSNVTVTADVTGPNGFSFTEAVSVASIEVDSSASFVFTLPIEAEDLGTYTMTYTVTSDSTDNLGDDNEVTFPFEVVEKELNKANDQLAGGFRASGATDIEIGNWYQVVNNDTVFQVKFAANWDSLTVNSDYVTGRVYRKVGAGFADTNFEQIGDTGPFYPTSANANNTWVTVDVYDINTTDLGVAVNAGDTLLITILYEGNSNVFISQADLLDYTHNFNFKPGFLNYLIRTGTSDNTWGTFTDGEDITFAVGGIMSDCELLASSNNFTQNINVEMFPNPVSTTLTANVTLDESVNFINYQVLDVHGRIVYRDRAENVSNDTFSFDVRNLPNGVYNLSISTGKGWTVKRFVVAK